MAIFKEKRVKLTLAIVGLLLVGYFVFRTFIKVDNWCYSYTSEDQALIYEWIGEAVAIILWLIIPIYLIVKGKPDERGVNAKRRLGVWLVVAPIILIVGGYIIIFSASVFVLYGIIIIDVIFIIGGIIYSIKNKAKIAIIPLLLVNLLSASAFWVFTEPQSKSMSSMGDMATMSNSATATMSTTDSMDTLGMSVGGAKDIENFRKNIENKYLPLSTDITYEGLYYDYFFDTGKTEKVKKLFSPSYSYAVSKDPLSKKDEYYLQVGLNSGIKEADFKRKKLNLVVVLDISGSMGSQFDSYYYDKRGNGESPKQKEEDAGKSKMEIATKSTVSLINHLNKDDRFGMVLFDDNAYVAKPISEVGGTDMDAIKGHILEIKERGGTNMEAGIKKGTELFEKYLDANQDEYENRIIFLTDAMPNQGQISGEDLLGMTKKNAENKIYTTFIGMGVDFNTSLIEDITKIRGANYYSVHSAKDFKTRMDDEFEYMVTPLVFNLALKLESPGYKIEKVYGSPEANESTGELMKVNTLFPSKSVDGKTKGGIVIVKLKKTGTDDALKLSTSYEDRAGKTDGEEVTIKFSSSFSEHYDNTGIRKGILLARYVNLMKNWIEDEKKSNEQKKQVVPMINYDTGITIPQNTQTSELGIWERQSISLEVSEEYKKMIYDFKNYFKTEVQAIDDNTLSKEVDIMEMLLK